MPIPETTGLRKSRSYPNQFHVTPPYMTRRVSSVTMLEFDDEKPFAFQSVMENGAADLTFFDEISLLPRIGDELELKDISKPCQSPVQSRWWHYLRNFGCHSSYFDGKPRPLFRGWIHGITSLSLLVIITLSLLNAFKLHWKFQAFMTGKFVVLAASATYHLFPFTSLHGVRTANIMDLILVPLSMWASVAPYSKKDVGVGFWTHLYLVMAILAVNGAIVLFQFSGYRHGQLPEETLLSNAAAGAKKRERLDSDDLNGSKPPLAVQTRESKLKKYCSDFRHALLFVFFSYVAIQSMRAIGLCGLWVVCIGLYVLSFIMAKFVDDAGYSHEPAYMPHHTRSVWSLHEDFHLTLLLADGASALMAAQYLYGSTPISFLT